MMRRPRHPALKGGARASVLARTASHALTGSRPEATEVECWLRLRLDSDGYTPHNPPIELHAHDTRAWRECLQSPRQQAGRWSDMVVCHSVVQAPRCTGQA